MEFMKGAELFDQIDKKESIYDSEAREDTKASTKCGTPDYVASEVWFK
jgi:hypothetical protein